MQTDNFSDTNYHSYSCPWNDYYLLIIQLREYGNILETVTVTSEYFNSTTSGMRIMMYSQRLEVYKNGTNAVYIKYASAGINNARIYGVLKK